ncbi:MAG: hypothetical protein DRN20_00595 [Thermoplasmata archaeon]|nr:MAG: hypothetical protein DRN20_00595 [Thermoplasmata archaeon]
MGEGYIKIERSPALMSDVTSSLLLSQCYYHFPYSCRKFYIEEFTYSKNPGKIKGGGVIEEKEKVG